MNQYTRDEVFKATVDYFDGDDLAADVFVEKYALRDLNGVFYEKTPEDMHRRIAKEFARIEANYCDSLTEAEIFELLSSWKIIPQGSPMSGIGNPFQVQSLSNCFVVQSPHDSYGGILKTDQEQVQIMKRRGGVGFDISTIRPKGVITANAARTTDGLGVFMERYSNSCREVAQGGRRGALMLTISIAHPEVETFINIKRDVKQKKVTGANVSVRVTDEFMEAVESNSDYVLRWPVDASVEEAKITKTVDARSLWNQIVTGAWQSAEPGILFWDTILKNSPADIFADKGFKTSSTNPCAEITLSEYDACRLMLMNATKYVKKPFTPSAEFDAAAFSRDAKIAQRLLDDLIDLEIEMIDKIIKKIEADPEPLDVKKTELNLWHKIKEKNLGGRRTGLGLTGIGDTVAMLGLEYGSNESITQVEKIYELLAVSAHISSVEMAKERGPFAVCVPERYAESHPVFDRLKSKVDDRTTSDLITYGRRNIALTTTAPAGSVSILAQTTSGIEPVFMTSYKRRRKVDASADQRVDYVDGSGDKWQEYVVTHHGVKLWQDVTGERDITKSPYHKSTSADINWKASVDLQAAAQKWVEHSISKTINLPSDVSVDLASDLYFKAWKSGCKGVTIYRDGSRSGVLVNNASSDSNEQPAAERVHSVTKRPKELPCDIHRTSIQGEVYMVLVGLLDGEPYEVFAGLQRHVEVPKKVKRGTLIKNGRDKSGVSTYNLRIPIGDDDDMLFKNIVDLFDNPLYGAFTRTLSLALRHGVPVQYLAEQLRKDKYSDMTSFSAVIARVLSKHYIPDGTNATSFEKTCSACNVAGSLAYQDGCVTCMNCGSSRCH